jgi:serine/threonine-protein kinase
VTKFLADETDNRLDRFELIAELASGGMATVYLGRLSGVGGFQRFVAIKRLHPHLANDQEFIQMFLDEARLAARLHHPNVVPILEIGTTEQGYYLVMEYIEGDTLARLLARSIQSGKALPIGCAIRIALDSLAGLNAAHDLTGDDGKPLEIVHRDVSPQNILLGMDGIGRITDFGVARAASRLTTTRSGQLKGKLAYMAPEQARGKDIDRRADVFAMGIVLWEALTQKRLFKGEGEAETLNRVLFEPIPAPTTAKADIPKEVEAVCMKALERDPAARWATCMDFADALEKAARNANVLASNRDVAQHILAVIGTDISQQRDALRAWLTRSEPSRQASFTVPSSQPSASKLPETSSVSSAVLAIPPGVATTQPTSPEPAKKSKLWMVAAAAVVVLAIGIPVALSKMKAEAPTVGAIPPATSTVAATPTPTPSPSPSATTPQAADSSIPVVAASALNVTKPPSTGKPTATAHVKPGGKPTGTAAATTTGTATTGPTSTKPSLPDENPYR